MSTELEAFFRPRSVAVIGAGSDPSKVRGRFIHNLKICGYEGTIYPVHPTHAEIQGLRAYPSVRHLPETPDLALIAISSEKVCHVLTECGEAGTGAAIVFSGIPGGEAGEALQARMSRIASETGLRIFGPNCLGLLSPFNRMAASFAPLEFSTMSADRQGERRVAIISQSGGIALDIFQRCQKEGLNVGHVLMPGNEADVDAVELLEHVLAEGCVDLVLMFIEGFRGGARFLRAARQANEQQIPIVILKTGRSRAGSRAAVSHTAHLTGSDTAYETVFYENGIIRVWEIEELMAVAVAVSRRNFMAGRRIGIVSSGGGNGGSFADLFEVNGLEVPTLDEATQSALAQVVPDYGSTLNPIDTGTTMDDHGKGFCKAVELVEGAGCIDAVYAVSNLGLPGVVAAMRPYLEPLAAKGRKPVILASAAAALPENIELAKEIGFNVLTPRAALHAFKALSFYGAHLARKVRLEAEPAVAARSQASSSGGSILDLPRHKMMELLQAYGIPLAPEALVRTAGEACMHAGRLGYPVALKIESKDIPHKTEAGGVIIHIADETDLLSAFDRIMHSARNFAPDARIDGVLVQKMARPGREMIVGMMTDEDFGPLLMVGFGGVLAEVLQDATFAMPPITQSKARDMIARLKGHQILKGVRGQGPADVEALAGLLVRLSQLVEDFPELGQVDLNPVILYEEGEGLCVVDTLLVGKD